MITRARATVLLWVAGLVVLVAVIAHTPFSSDMSAFLPRSPDPAQQILVEQIREGVASRLILVGLEGSTPATLAAVSRSIAADLRPMPDFSLVDNGEGGIGKADQAYVWNNRYLLSPKVTADHFSPEGLHEALVGDLGLLTGGMAPLLKDSISHDPTGEAIALATELAGDAHRLIQDGVWVARDGTRALLLLQTRAPGFDLDAQEHALKALDQAFTKARQQVPDGQVVRLLRTGPGVFGVNTRARMKRDVTTYSTIGTAFIVGLLLWVYRSPRMLFLTLVPVVSGAFAGIVAVGLRFGFVHGITVGFGITLIGEAVDYAIYLLAQSAPDQPPRDTLGRIWPTLRLGMLVSACGFATMLFSSFTGFVQLGMLTFVGLAVALTVTRFVLPHLVPAGFAGLRTAGFAPVLLRVARQAPKLRLPLLVMTVAALVVVFLHPGSLWQDELSSMSPVSAADQALDRDLRRDVGAPDVRYLVIVQAADREGLLVASEQAAVTLDPLVSAGALSGYDSPARYLPSEAMQRRRQAALLDRPRLAQNLAGALVGLPFRPDIFGPFLDDVARAKTMQPLTRIALEGTALSLKLDSLLIDHPGQELAVLSLRDVHDADRIAQDLAAVPGARLLDLKTESDRLLHRYRQEAITLALLGSAVIAVLLIVSFRALKPALSVLVPLAVAVIVTLCVLTLGGRQLSIFNLFGLLLVVAVGSNYCLFFQRGGLSGPAGERTVTSLLLANVCTVAGFGALSFSAIPVLYGIGGTVALGTAMSLIAGAVLARAPAP